MCIGALTIIADFMGAIGSGTGAHVPGSKVGCMRRPPACAEGLSGAQEDTCLQSVAPANKVPLSTLKGVR